MSEIVASSPFSPPTAAFKSPLTCLLFMMSHKWRACSQAKDDDDNDDDDDDSAGSDDDGDDNDDHHHDDQR